MTHASDTPGESHTEGLWSRAAALLAAFVRRHVGAGRLATMRETPAVILADVLCGLRRIEAFARRVLFAQALALRVDVKASPPRDNARKAARPASTPAPLQGDPATWRVRFSVPLPPLPQPPRPRAHARERSVRHPILSPPERMARLPQPHRPYDAAYAEAWRARKRRREEAAYNAFWYAPLPPPPEGPLWLELPISNQHVDMASTWPVARRMEALARVIADPAPYARRLAVRLARRPAHAPKVLAHWQARRRRVPEGETTLRLAQLNFRARADDS